MMFSSRHGADLPWRAGQRVNVISTDDAYYTIVMRDRPQHNPTNPILLDFREMHGDARMWLDVIQGEDGDAFLAGTPKEFGRVTAEHIGHAIRVLTRLANLAKDS